jgi:hypothetical protein
MRRPAKIPSPEIFLSLPGATFQIRMAVAGEDRHGYAIIQEVAARRKPWAASCASLTACGKSQEE